MNPRFATGALAGIAALAPAAFAQDAAIFTFGFTDLAGSFDSGGGVFSAASTASTNGDLTRLEPTATTAGFDFGGPAGSSDVQFDISVDDATSIATPGLGVVGTSAGFGSFQISDADGDTLGGNISGSWLRTATGQLFFNALLSDVTFDSDDGLFNGTDGSSFSTAYNGTSLEGTLVVLSFDPSGNFFSSSFGNVSTQVSGRLLATGPIIPAPAAAGVLGIGLAMGARRRR